MSMINILRRIFDKNYIRSCETLKELDKYIDLINYQLSIAVNDGDAQRIKRWSNSKKKILRQKELLKRK